MVSRPLSSLSAVRKQFLLAEFSSLRTCCPHGVFVSLTPGDASLWCGVMFVRKGPYAPSILRFQISFPLSYPALPPLVTFSTDIFHPLITPLTTYMYTTDIQHTGTVSATDEERLPPGGFSLRHGFPSWFGRASKKMAERSRQSAEFLHSPGPGGRSQIVRDVASPDSTTTGSPSPMMTQTSSTPKQKEFGVYEVLRYIRSVFDEEKVLDAVPLEAAGNPGAWHAWRTHQAKLGKVIPMVETNAGLQDDTISVNSSADLHASSQNARDSDTMQLPAVRSGEWNWDGVWEVRVKRGVEGSISEAVLYGNMPGDDLIRFLHMQTDEVETIKDNIKRSAEAQAIRRESSRKSLGA